MNNLETIVRPFTAGELAPPRLAPYATPTQVAPVVRLYLGRSGSPKSVGGSYNASATVYVIKYPRELNIFDDISSSLQFVIDTWGPSLLTAGI